jgi:hypothetical protein
MWVKSDSSSITKMRVFMDASHCPGRVGRQDVMQAAMGADVPRARRACLLRVDMNDRS